MNFVFMVGSIWFFGHAPCEAFIQCNSTPPRTPLIIFKSCAVATSPCVMGGLLRQLAEILRLIGFEFFDAGLATKFDLLAVIDLGDGAAHAVEVVATDEALGERVRLGFFSGERWLWRGAGGEGEAQQGGGEEGMQFMFVSWCGFCFSMMTQVIKSGRAARPRGRTVSDTVQ
jgi:hypothetical protein